MVDIFLLKTFNLESMAVQGAVDAAVELIGTLEGFTSDAYLDAAYVGFYVKRALSKSCSYWHSLQREMPFFLSPTQLELLRLGAPLFRNDLQNQVNTLPPGDPNLVNDPLKPIPAMFVNGYYTTAEWLSGAQALVKLLSEHIPTCEPYWGQCHYTVAKRPEHELTMTYFLPSRPTEVEA